MTDDKVTITATGQESSQPGVSQGDEAAARAPDGRPDADPRRPPAPGRRHERFMAAIIESAEDAILAKTLDGTILSWNAGAERMYGYRAEDIVGRKVHDLAPPERHGEIDMILVQIRKGLRIQHFETERIRRNGERFPVSVSISPVQDADGHIIGASTVARDITEQRRLALAIDRQRSFVTAVSEASIDGILVVDPDDQIVFSNRRFVEMWGIDTVDLAGKSNQRLLDGLLPLVRNPDAVIADVRRLSASPTERSRDDVRLVDGRVFDRYSAPVRGNDNRLYGRIWYFRDVTAQTVRIAQLQAVIAAVDDAAIVFDPAGEALLRNPAAERLLPPIERYADLVAYLDDTQPAGREQIGPSAGGPGRDALESVRGRDDTDAEFRVVIDGRRSSLVVSRRVVVDRDRPPDPDLPRTREGMPPLGLLVLVRDVTALRDAEASREAFVGLLSHELRTPVTTIYAASKMLQRQGDAELKYELVGDIEAESERLYRLVEDLLVLTRIERDSLEILDQPVLVAPIVRRPAGRCLEHQPGFRGDHGGGDRRRLADGQR